MDQLLVKSVVFVGSGLAKTLKHQGKHVGINRSKNFRGLIN